MKALIQRVKNASVTIDGKVNGQINQGLCVLLGVGPKDSEKDIDWLSEKLINLRIFEDENGKMNLSLRDIDGQMLIISQFTLYGDCSRGRRPSFVYSAPPDMANELYEKFVAKIRSLGIIAETGIFGADMQVSILNDGPVTFMIESELK
ncbi:MAG: D-tyrosyl-tRNA(Tyr) deacylase [Alphaproteobacteria bacterium ADurb.Bin438]|nr:MAG: D-tyrosyl-tRNA(Tyr) deacylase [Alphaproteobacteria bacterium ADurb.Bin438]